VIVTYWFFGIPVDRFYVGLNDIFGMHDAIAGGVALGYEVTVIAG